jgi:ribosomal protein S18 acetylase RimI-like enzyme
MDIEISPLRREHIPQAAALFVESCRKQRRATPSLSDRLEDAERVAAMLDRMLGTCPGVAAVEDGRLVGYMVWYIVDRFRKTDRKGAYCPEWGHATVDEKKPEIYRAMYRVAAAGWAAAGCQVHAVTLLAYDRAAEQVWFWNGFGLTVVDAVRPMRPLDGPCSTPVSIRKATQADAPILAILDAEHCRHYTASPVFMPPPHNGDAAQFAEFLSRPKNSVWLAMDGKLPVGFIRYDGYDSDGVEIVNGEAAAYITGAYVRPAYRGRKVGAALLDGAFRDYAGQGLTCCAVNFESFNPEAASFWMRHFEPVCLSVLRVPETLGAQP